MSFITPELVETRTVTWITNPVKQNVEVLWEKSHSFIPAIGAGEPTPKVFGGLSSSTKEDKKNPEKDKGGKDKGKGVSFISFCIRNFLSIPFLSPFHPPILLQCHHRRKRVSLSIQRSYLQRKKLVFLLNIQLQSILSYSNSSDYNNGSLRARDNHVCPHWTCGKSLCIATGARK